MKMNEILTIAKNRGIPFKFGLSKEKLIHAIQINEGYDPCFRRKAGCDEENCLWMDDCIPKKQV